MKGSKYILVLAMLMGLVSAVAAQEEKQRGFYGDTGLYGEYFRFQGLQTDMAGVGGRLSLNVFSTRYEDEAEFGFLGNRGLSKNISSGNSNIRVLHGLFGPKLDLLHGKVRPFVTAKGGFFNTEINGGAPQPAFASQIGSIRRNNISAAFYPGGGLQASLGDRFSLRLDVGDEIVFNDRVNHNLRITFGPRLTF